VIIGATKNHPYGEMTDRDRGNSDAPRVDEGRDDASTRRVGDARREHEADCQRRESELGTSWVSVVLGLLTALGAGLILSGIVGGIVGAILGTGSATQSAAEGGIASIIGLLITLLLAFLIGGYAAGRMAGRSGLKHGLLVALLYLLITVVLALIGAAVGTDLINFSGVTLPDLPSGVQQEAPQSLGPSRRVRASPRSSCRLSRPPWAAPGGRRQAADGRNTRPARNRGRRGGTLRPFPTPRRVDTRETDAFDGGALRVPPFCEARVPCESPLVGFR
jgi:hypothetical protein